MPELSEFPIEDWVMIDGRLYLSLWGRISHGQYLAKLPDLIAEPGFSGFTTWRSLRGENPIQVILST